MLAWLQTDQAAGIVGFVNRVLNLAEVALMLAGVALIIYNIVAWSSAEYVVTNRRVMGHEGLLRKRETDSLLTAISDVRMKKTGLGGVLDYGSIGLLTTSGQAGADNFTAVRKPDEFKKVILEQKIAAEAGRANSMPSPAVQPSGNGAQADAVAAMSTLNGLRDAGAITAAEYDAKKAEILARVLTLPLRPCQERG